MIKRHLGLTILISLWLFSLVAWGNASNVDRLIDNAANLHERAKASQARIDQMSDSARELFARFQIENNRVEDLIVYNTQLQKQIDQQQRKTQEIEQTLQEIAVVERQIAPLLLRMIRGLEQFIELDIPFLLDERRERIQSLYAMMDRADVTIAEKFRQVIEAYGIEQTFGNTIETYHDTLQFDQPREVEMLRIGRVALIYQTLDGSAVGAWHAEKQAFVPIDNLYRREIRKGLKMAKKQLAPDLLKLPILSPAQLEAQP